MGWSTDLFCNIHFHKQTYNSLYEVEDAIEQCNNMIKYAKQKLHSLAMITEPNKFCGEDSDPLCWIESEFNDWMEELEEHIIKRNNLYYLQENWNTCHNEKGLAINPPENIHYDSAFLDGDFIRSIKRPDADSFK